MTKRKQYKPKSDRKPIPRSQTPLRALLVLSLGILIAVIGSLTVPSFLAEREDGLSVIISIISLIVGVTLALWGLKMMRPVSKKKRKKAR